MRGTVLEEKIFLGVWGMGHGLVFLLCTIVVFDLEVGRLLGDGDEDECRCVCVCVRVCVRVYT